MFQALYTSNDDDANDLWDQFEKASFIDAHTDVRDEHRPVHHVGAQLGRRVLHRPRTWTT